MSWYLPGNPWKTRWNSVPEHLRPSERIFSCVCLTYFQVSYRNVIKSSAYLSEAIVMRISLEVLHRVKNPRRGVNYFKNEVFLGHAPNVRVINLKISENPSSLSPKHFCGRRNSDCLEHHCLQAHKATYFTSAPQYRCNPWRMQPTT